jgi:hypothetical protein
MSELKSFIKWAVEEKKETPTIFKIVSDENYLKDLLNTFIEEAYGNNDLSVIVSFYPIDKNNFAWTSVFIEIFARVPANSACRSQGITFKNGMHLKEADALISQVIYNIIIVEEDMNEQHEIKTWLF